MARAFPERITVELKLAPDVREVIGVEVRNHLRTIRSEIYREASKVSKTEPDVALALCRLDLIFGRAIEEMEPRADRSDI